MLIKTLEINNFRCFHKTIAKDFSNINLFGGRNNAGKTALLEALLLLNEPSNPTIALLLKFRRIDSDFIKSVPKRAWDSFFYKQQKDEIIEITAITNDGEKQVASMKCDESVEDFINLIQNNEIDKDDEDMLAFANSLSGKDATKSTLHINSTTNGITNSASVFIASNNGIIGRGIPNSFLKAHFIPASFKLASDNLAEEFDKAKLEGLSDILLSAFQIIDGSIEQVDTFKIGKSAIFLKRKNEKNFMPLALFGDAMNKIADFILRIVNNKNSVILIDEIENGIHHSNQEELWKMLFELSIKFEVQVFATSHSAEMITAFKNVAKSKYPKESRYFEIARHVITNEISIQKIPIEALEEKLITKKPVRGE